MSSARFRGEILAGHKGATVEVPFDPAERWGLAAIALWRGRRGHRVTGVVQKLRFESSVVPRSKRFWLLLDEDLLDAAGLAVGDRVDVAIEPSASAPAPSSAPAPASRSRRSTGPPRASRSRSGRRRAP